MISANRGIHGIRGIHETSANHEIQESHAKVESNGTHEILGNLEIRENREIRESAIRGIHEILESLGSLEIQAIHLPVVTHRDAPRLTTRVVVAAVAVVAAVRIRPDKRARVVSCTLPTLLIHLSPHIRRSQFNRRSSMAVADTTAETVVGEEDAAVVVVEDAVVAMVVVLVVAETRADKTRGRVDQRRKTMVAEVPDMAADTTPAVRVDKWLWAIRVFRTRSAAATACQGGKVRVNGLTAKPARSLRVGDVIEANNGTLTRTVKVTGLLQNRVGAAKVAEYCLDQTPESEYAAARERQQAPVGARPAGSGRPTKRDRRILQSFFGQDGQDGN